MGKWQRFLTARHFLLLMGTVFFFSPLSLGFISSPVHAASPQQLTCEGSGGKWSGGRCRENRANGPSVPTTIKSVINILLFVVGAIAVIVIVVSAFRFVNSGGDTQQVSKAKDAIIYALVGVVVAAAAYVIVNFVLEQL